MTGWRMRPTSSALGVIAIVVSVMITATASETSSGAMDHNHSLVDPEDRRIPVDDDPRTLNWTLVGVPGLDTRSNDTANELAQLSLSNLAPSSHNEPEIASASFGELQGDESGSSSDFGPSGNIWAEDEDAALGEDELDNPRNKAQDSSRDYSVSTGPSRAEASTLGPWEDQVPWRSELEDVQVEDEGLAAVLERVDDEGAVEAVLEPHNREYLDGAVTWISGVATDSRPSEQRNVEDIRAISFPVPPPAEQFQDRFDGRQHDEEPRKETRKEHGRPMNNHLLGTGKSTKAFYEIKPSIRTEIENDQLYPASTHRTLPRKFVLPTVGIAYGKFGPYFEDGDQDANVTARIGSTMLLDCRIGMLGDKEVAWLQQHSEDSFRLLTVGRNTYSVDQRISLNFRYPSNWRLQIRYASPRDSGLYKCQITTHPPMVKKINVVVTAPELTITDDSGRVVPKERHLKAGSALKLRCEVRDVLESLKETVIWTRGDETLTDDVSENRTTEVSVGKEVLVIVSTLIVERASPRHAGNYSCVVPGKVNTTIAVHVLNGELPAAVHDGNGVSRAFLNLWLIHLTMSYVFSR
nr:uncharacterized protein LOC117221719 [Megalopta genalis]